MPVHWQVLGRKLQCGVRDMKTRRKDSSVTTLKSLEDKADSGECFLVNQVK